MIRGSVNARCEATVRLPLKDAKGEEQPVEGIIDTGFNGSLTLSRETIRQLGLLWRTRGNAVLANGAVDQFDICAAIVIWDGAPRSILVEEVETMPLVGMALLRGHHLSIRVVDGGSVTIAAL